MKNNKGITLIALVITIIILIILAGVGISLTIGDNGIFNKAEQAKEDYKTATNEEQEGIANVEVAIGELTEGNQDFKKFKAGDYIKYDTGDSTVGENGIVTCRVLYEASSKYGLQIVTDKNVANVRLGILYNYSWDIGKSAYNNAIKTLNAEAEKYLNKNYAIDARCVGSLPTVDVGGKMINKNKGGDTTVKLPASTWDSSSYIRPSNWSSDDTGCFVADENYKTDYNTMVKIGGNGIHNIKEHYWLASRDVRSFSSTCYFYVRNVNPDGDSCSSNNLCEVKVNGTTDARSYAPGLRPVFSLKSNIKITGGDGTSEKTAYTLGI